jgi:small subunit ribosomal protein S4
MARYTESVCKLCRREGGKLFLKGERCFSSKCAVERRAYPPGMHGPQRQFRRKVSDYALQLREKQKARRIYGIFERQFRRYFRDAERRRGLTGTNLLVTLESRLDNIVYRLGLAESRPQARQIVCHGHIVVNGKRTDIPSFLTSAGDTIAVAESSKRSPLFQSIGETLSDRMVPSWLSIDSDNMMGTVLSVPSREEIDVSLEEQLIVEYYSR